MGAAFPQCPKFPLNYETLASPSSWDILTGDDDAPVNPNAFTAKSNISAEPWFIPLVWEPLISSSSYNASSKVFFLASF